MRKAVVCLFLLFSVLFAQSETVQITVHEVPGVVSASALARSTAASIEVTVLRQNDAALQVYQQGCSNWTQNNLHQRDLGLPLTAKPVQPLAIHLATAFGGVDPVIVSMTTTVGPDALGTVCADLPPLPAAPPPNNFVLGTALGYGWYSAGALDTVPPNTVVTLPSGQKLKKVASMFAAGYYQEVN